MASARSTIIATRTFFNADVGRCSAQVIVLGGLMVLPGALITGLGYANGNDVGDFYMLGPIMLSLGLVFVVCGVVFKVLVKVGVIKPANQRQGAEEVICPPRSDYPWSIDQGGQPLPEFPPPYTIEVTSTNIPPEIQVPEFQVPITVPEGDTAPPIYTPTAETEVSGYDNEAFSSEPPPPYEEEDTTR